MTLLTRVDDIHGLQAPKHALGQAYKVNVFLGEFDPDTTTWHTQDALVGTIAVFGSTCTVLGPV